MVQTSSTIALGSNLTSKHRFIQSIAGVLKIADFGGWQKWSGAAILGFASAISKGNSFSLLQIQGIAIGMPLVLSYNQAINDCFDVEIDKVKEEMTGKKLVVTNTISYKTALAVTCSFLLIGLISSWFASASLFLFCLFGAVLGTLYSAPPFRLKMRYPFSTLIQFLGCFFPFLAGAASIGNLTIQTLAISSSFAVFAIIQRFNHEITNYEVDFRTGKKTIAVVKGLKTAILFRRFALLLGIMALVVFFILGWLNIVLLFLFGVYLFLIISSGIWLRFLPPPVKAVLAPLLMVSSYLLLIIVLILYGANYV